MEYNFIQKRLKSVSCDQLTNMLFVDLKIGILIKISSAKKKFLRKYFISKRGDGLAASVYLRNLTTEIRHTKLRTNLRSPNKVHKMNCAK